MYSVNKENYSKKTQIKYTHKMCVILTAQLSALTFRNK